MPKGDSKYCLEKAKNDMKKTVNELMDERQNIFDEKTKNIIDIFSLNVSTALKSILKIGGDVQIYNVIPLDVNPKYATVFGAIVISKEKDMYKAITVIVPVLILEEDCNYDEIKRVLTNIINFLSANAGSFEKRSDVYIHDLEGTFFIDMKNDNLFSIKNFDKEISVKM